MCLIALEANIILTPCAGIHAIYLFACLSVVCQCICMHKYSCVAGKEGYKLRLNRMELCLYMFSVFWDDERGQNRQTCYSIIIQCVEAFIKFTQTHRRLFNDVCILDKIKGICFFDVNNTRMICTIVFTQKHLFLSKPLYQTIETTINTSKIAIILLNMHAYIISLFYWNGLLWSNFNGWFRINGFFFFISWQSI